MGLGDEVSSKDQKGGFVFIASVVSCSICLEAVTDSDDRWMAKLQCGHEFHLEFSCQICKKVMNQPLTTPCALNFWKACLEGAFTGQKHMREVYQRWEKPPSQGNNQEVPFLPS